MGRKKTLDKRGHSFCIHCIDQAYEKYPVCSLVYRRTLMPKMKNRGNKFNLNPRIQHSVPEVIHF